MDGLHLLQDLEEPLLRGLAGPKHREAIHLTQVDGALNLLRLLVQKLHVIEEVNLGREVGEVHAGGRQLHAGRGLCSLLT